MENVHARCTCGCTTERFYPDENQWEPDCWDCWDQAREMMLVQPTIYKHISSEPDKDDLPF